MRKKATSKVNLAAARRFARDFNNRYRKYPSEADERQVEGVINDLANEIMSLRRANSRLKRRIKVIKAK